MSDKIHIVYKAQVYATHYYKDEISSPHRPHSPPCTLLIV